MFLAHGGGGGGANFEALVLAVPMVIVGVILFAQKTAKPVVPLVLVLGGFAIAVGGFTVLKPAAEEHTDAEIVYGDMLVSMCMARDLAAGGDVDDADAIFEDDVHVRLHGLADQLTDDRAVAGRLLESKQAVEADLDDSDVGPDELSSDMGELIAATEAALSSLEMEVDGCG